MHRVSLTQGDEWRCLVHGGFAQAYSSISEKLLLEHKRLFDQHQPSSILITGHSLGGALATLFAMELLSRGLYTPQEAHSLFSFLSLLPQRVLNHYLCIQVWFITFGQPRVGDSLWLLLTIIGCSSLLVGAHYWALTTTGCSPSTAQNCLVLTISLLLS